MYFFNHVVGQLADFGQDISVYGLFSYSRTTDRISTREPHSIRIRFRASAGVLAATVFFCFTPSSSYSTKNRFSPHLIMNHLLQRRPKYKLLDVYFRLLSFITRNPRSLPLFYQSKKRAAYKTHLPCNGAREHAFLHLIQKIQRRTNAIVIILFEK